MTRYEIFVEAVKKICDNPTQACKVANSYVPVVEAADGKGRSYETLKELALWLLTEANILNVFHWNVDKNNKHELLNEAYELCRDTGDNLAETYIALTGNKCTPPTGKDFGGKAEWAPSEEEILNTLHMLNDHMNDACDKNPNFSEGVKNIFADFDQAMTKIIYKYTMFSA